MVEMRGICRRFGAVQALDSVDLIVSAGTIHAVVGENGAGKTTLMRILYGADRPDSGTTRIEGKEVSLAKVADGIACGVGMVSQHYSIIPELTCLQNLMLGAEGGAVIDGKSAQKRAQNLAAEMSFQFDWNAEASTLSPAGAQKLEILKLLWRNSRVMILDEPTAMLSPADSDALFASLKQLAQSGATIIVVTHRLSEVLEHCHAMTVLRGGKLVGVRDVPGPTAQELAELIIGKSLAKPEVFSEPGDGETVLVCKNVCVRGGRGNRAVDEASFELKRGEVLGIAGVDGSGQRELFWALWGVSGVESGVIQWIGQPLGRMSVRERVELGFRLIAEDRHQEGVVDAWSLEDNANLGLQRLPEFRSGVWVRTAERANIAERMANRFSTKRGGMREPMASLSGGNQQRFINARALDIRPSLILAFQPTRGLDIAATHEVFAAIRAACRSGASALIVSFDLDELIENCDRVGVMINGKYVEPPAGCERDRAEIGRLMVGAG